MLRADQLRPGMRLKRVKFDAYSQWEYLRENSRVVTWREFTGDDDVNDEPGYTRDHGDVWCPVHHESLFKVVLGRWGANRGQP